MIQGHDRGMEVAPESGKGEKVDSLPEPLEGMQL